MVYVLWGQWRWRIYADSDFTEHVMDKDSLWLAHVRPYIDLDGQIRQRETGARTRHAALSGNETTKIGKDLLPITYDPYTDNGFRTPGGYLVYATLVHFRPDMTVWTASQGRGCGVKDSLELERE